MKSSQLEKLIEKLLLYIQNSNSVLLITTIIGMLVGVVIVGYIIEEYYLYSYCTNFIKNIFIAIRNFVLYILLISLGGFLGYCVGMFPIISTVIITIAAIVSFAYYQTKDRNHG